MSRFGAASRQASSSSCCTTAVSATPSRTSTAGSSRRWSVMYKMPGAVPYDVERIASARNAIAPSLGEQRREKLDRSAAADNSANKGGAACSGWSCGSDSGAAVKGTSQATKDFAISPNIQPLPELPAKRVGRSVSGSCVVRHHCRFSTEIPLDTHFAVAPMRHTVARFPRRVPTHHPSRICSAGALVITRSSSVIFCQILLEKPLARVSISFTAPSTTGSAKCCANSADTLLARDSSSLQ